MNNNPYNLTEQEIADIRAAQDAQLRGEDFEEYSPDRNEWSVVPYATSIVSFSAGFRYRPIRPKQTVPLTADDIPDDAVFLSPSFRRLFPLAIADTYIVFCGNSDNGDAFSFEKLSQGAWRYRRAGESEWKPCSKEGV